MSGHTPGPWTVEPGLLSAFHFEAVVCWRAREERLTGKTIRANARLIAAAPEMLDHIREWAAIDCSEYPQHCPHDDLCITCRARALLAQIETP